MSSVKKNVEPVKPVRVAIYLRVSTLEQVEDGGSLESQLDRCRRLINLHEADGWKEFRVYSDPGFSGGTMDRPSLKDMLDDAEAGLFDIIIIYKFDRLTRKLSDFHKIWERLKDLNVGLVAASQEINTQTSTGRLMLNMLMSFAEFERDLIRERSQMGTEYAFNSADVARSMGGRDPFGYTYDKNRQVYVIVEDEAKWVRQVFSLHIQGISHSKIAAYLNEQGARTRVRSEKSRKTGSRTIGGNEFNQDAIRRILINPVHVGKIQYDGVIKEGGHEAILDREMREKWEEIYKKLVPTKDPKGNPKKAKHELIQDRNKWGLLFKGILFDATSGQAMTVAPSGKVRPNSNEPHLYYEAAKDRKIVGKDRARFPARELEKIALMVFETLAKEPQLVDLILRADSSSVRSRISDLELQLGRTKAEIADHKRNLQTTIELRSKPKSQGRVTMQNLEQVAEGFGSKVEELTERETRLSSELSSLRSDLLSEDAIRKGLQNFRSTFERLPSENKANLCRVFFKKIEVREIPTGEVVSKSQGYALANGTVVFPVKRTKWVEMKFDVRANVDYHRIFSDEAKVRIQREIGVPKGI